jgi:hypothetical protein
MVSVNGRTRLAHRFFYEQKRGPIPNGLGLDHLCRNRACVNPDHLEPVEHATNVRRGVSAKINPTKVRQIKAMHAQGTHTIREIATAIGATYYQVQKVVQGRTWKDIV